MAKVYHVSAEHVGLLATTNLVSRLPSRIALSFALQPSTLASMGQRHNRKRTRSRPTRRVQAMSPIPEEITCLSAWSPPPFEHLSTLVRSGTPTSSCSDDEDPIMAKRISVFGGDAGDEAGELCAPMLQVVLDLFDGVDYEDP